MPTAKPSAAKPVTRASAAKKAAKATLGSVESMFKQWRQVKSQVASLTTRQNDLRDLLKGEVETKGYEDDRGHLWLELAQPIDGYMALKSERRVSQLMNEEEAERILKAKKLYDTCTVTVTHIDPEAINKEFFKGNISKRELDQIFTQQVTYAFVPAKSK